MPNFPDKLYKFTREKYALEMVVEGKLRTGTLHNFQNEDKYGLEIGDRGEGTQRTYMGRKPINLSDPNTIPPTIKRMLETGRLKGPGKLIIDQSINENTENMYIYSLTTDKSLINKFGIESAGYDSIIEINNVEGFIIAISKELRKIDSSIERCSGDYIEYTEREKNHDEQTNKHPVFVKDPRHSWQKEYRLVWDTVEKEITPINIQSFEIKKYISLL